MGRRVLVVASHPDDDVLGCGAAIARWVQEGRQFIVAFLTNGVAAGSVAGPAAAEGGDPRHGQRQRSWGSWICDSQPGRRSDWTEPRCWRWPRALNVWLQTRARAQSC